MPQKNRLLANFSLLFAALLMSFLASPLANAVTLDWKGYFRADNNYLRNYQMDGAAPGNTGAGAADGEFIRGEGSKTLGYTSFFAKLKPSALINDNIIIHSEWNVGDQVTGFFGRNVSGYDRKNSLTTNRGTMSIEAARLWMDAHTDFGLLQVGRAPMHWGLGVVYNSGDEPFDRFQSSSDTIRFVSKFGYLSLMPYYAKVSMGSNLAGSQDSTGAVMRGSDDVTDYGVAIKFHNPEDEIEAGILFNKRNAPDQQNAFYYPHSTNLGAYSTGSNGMNLSLFDIYARKTWYKLTVAAELPYYSGKIGDVNGVNKRNEYKATGFAGEMRLDFDRWHHSLRFGLAPGQGPVTTGNRGTSYEAMYFHRNYKIGQIMFARNLGAFGNNNPDNVAAASVLSPYDSAIANAKYVALGTENRGESWSWSVGFAWAQADESAQSGKDFYIHRTRRYGNSAAVESQGKDLGFEVDLGLGYHWDENIRFGMDLGFFFPGSYYEFDNLLNRSPKSDLVTAVTFSAMARF